MSIFGKWRKSKVDQSSIDKIIFGYECALEEIDSLIVSIEERSNAIPVSALPLDSLNILRSHRVKISQNRAEISVSSRNFRELADEAEAMDRLIAELCEIMWGYDEARMSGLLLAWGALKTNADSLS